MLQRGQQEGGRVHGLALEQGRQSDGRDRGTLTVILQRFLDGLEGDPLLAEEAAAGVGVNAKVDFVVRRAPMW